MMAYLTFHGLRIPPKKMADKPILGVFPPRQNRKDKVARKRARTAKRTRSRPPRLGRQFHLREAGTGGEEARI